MGTCEQLSISWFERMRCSATNRKPSYSYHLGYSELFNSFLEPSKMESTLKGNLSSFQPEVPYVLLLSLFKRFHLLLGKRWLKIDTLNVFLTHLPIGLCSWQQGYCQLCLLRKQWECASRTRNYRNIIDEGSQLLCSDIHH